VIRGAAGNLSRAELDPTESSSPWRVACRVPGPTSVCPAYDPNIRSSESCSASPRLPLEVLSLSPILNSSRHFVRKMQVIKELIFYLAASTLNLSGCGLVPRCAACEHVLLRLMNVRHGECTASRVAGHAGSDVRQVQCVRGRAIPPLDRLQLLPRKCPTSTASICEYKASRDYGSVY
jgi:hypothetical protein